MIVDATNAKSKDDLVELKLTPGINTSIESNFHGSQVRFNTG